MYLQGVSVKNEFAGKVKSGNALQDKMRRSPVRIEIRKDALLHKRRLPVEHHG